MNLHDLTIGQLKRAVAIKENIEDLNRELDRMLGGSNHSNNQDGASTQAHKMSAAARKRIAASQRARWAKLRRAKAARESSKPAAETAKKKMAPATRAKLSAKLKSYWAAKKKQAKQKSG